MKKGDTVYYLEYDNMEIQGRIYKAKYIRHTERNKVEISYNRADVRYVKNKEQDCYTKKTKEVSVSNIFETYSLAIESFIEFLKKEEILIDHVEGYKKWNEEEEKKEKLEEKTELYAKSIGELGFNYVFTFGKYKNCTLEFVFDANPGYLVWLHTNTSFKVEKDIYRAAVKKSHRYVTVYNDDNDYDAEPYY
jgi:hypothetical protein